MTIHQPLLTTSKPLDKHNIKWDHFDILAKGKDYHCKIKETLFIQELEPAFNVNVWSENLMLYWSTLFFYSLLLSIFLYNLGSRPLTIVTYK